MFMQLTTLTALSPIDGRYRKQVQQLAAYFSEFALIKYRVWVEIEYLFFLADEGFCHLPAEARNHMRSIATHFSEAHATRIKEIEATTNHDVKAVEYFLKEQLDTAGAGNVKEWVHFGLTSQDVNNTAIPLSWKHFIEQQYLPAINGLISQLHQFAKEWSGVALLARTHGQPASPTTLGKELMVFVERLRNQLQLLECIPFAAKFGGATGNFNAHHVAFPQKNWVELGNKFVQQHLQLQRLQFTTQIEHYDHFAAHFDTIKRINTVLIDLCRDLWTYISIDYFKQKTRAGEVGSSAMPHKVNPIDFENAEGNLGWANAQLEHLAAKLPISRLQRDLTDSTVLRNIGVPAAHVMIAISSIQKGLGKLLLNPAAISADLDNNWAVVAEAIQTILRRENYPEPYEALKELTRGKANITQTDIHNFVAGLQVSEPVKAELAQITPFNYTGVCPLY